MVAQSPYGIPDIDEVELSDGEEETMAGLRDLYSEAVIALDELADRPLDAGPALLHSR